MHSPTVPLDVLLERLREWYEPLRQQARSAGAHGDLCEDSEGGGGCQCSERFLQILWNEQRLAPVLATTAGLAVEVVSPGTWNVSGGPDFSGAVLRLGGHLCRGAVEVHTSAADWFRHGHDRDSAYADVILHVVWQVGGGNVPAVPCLELRSQLEAPLRDLLEELQATVYPYAARSPQASVPCAGP